jgi:hypothetical protein
MCRTDGRAQSQDPLVTAETSHAATGCLMLLGVCRVRAGPHPHPPTEECGKRSGRGGWMGGVAPWSRTGAYGRWRVTARTTFSPLLVSVPVVDTCSCRVCGCDVPVSSVC